MQKALSTIASFQNRSDVVSTSELKRQLDSFFVSTLADNTITLGTDKQQKAELDTIKIKLI
jgi:hypothetical protein